MWSTEHLLKTGIILLTHNTLDFVVNGFFMKLFRTSNMDIVRDCQCYFGFKLPSELWSNRVKMFDVKYVTIVAGTSVFCVLLLLFCSTLSVFVCCVYTISISDE